MLGHLKFERLKTVEADGTAKSNDGGLADTGLVRQIYYTHVDDIVRMTQYETRNLGLGFTQSRFIVCDATYQIR